MTKKDLAKSLKVIGEENRLLILCLLMKDKHLCVTAIASSLKLSVATTSFHLKTLERAGITKSVREGKEICYALKDISFTQDIKKLICKNINIKI